MAQPLNSGLKNPYQDRRAGAQANSDEEDVFVDCKEAPPIPAATSSSPRPATAPYITTQPLLATATDPQSGMEALASQNRLLVELHRNPAAAATTLNEDDPVILPDPAFDPTTASPQAGPAALAQEPPVEVRHTLYRLVDELQRMTPEPGRFDNHLEEILNRFELLIPYFREDIPAAMKYLTVLITKLEKYPKNPEPRKKIDSYCERLNNVYSAINPSQEDTPVIKQLSRLTMSLTGDPELPGILESLNNPIISNIPSTKKLSPESLEAQIGKIEINPESLILSREGRVQIASESLDKQKDARKSESPVVTSSLYEQTLASNRREMIKQLQRDSSELLQALEKNSQLSQNPDLIKDLEEKSSILDKMSQPGYISNERDRETLEKPNLLKDFQDMLSIFGSIRQTVPTETREKIKSNLINIFCMLSPDQLDKFKDRIKPICDDSDNLVTQLKIANKLFDTKDFLALSLMIQSLPEGAIRVKTANRVLELAEQTQNLDSNTISFLIDNIVQHLPEDRARVDFANRVLGLAAEKHNLESNAISSLSSMVQHLPKEARVDFANKILETNSEHFLFLSDMVQHLPEGRARVDFANKILETNSDSIFFLSNMVQHLPKEAKEGFVNRALELAEKTLNLGSSQIRSLSSMVQHLPKEAKERIANRALALVKRIPNLYSLNSLDLTSLAKVLPKEAQLGISNRVLALTESIPPLDLDSLHIYCLTLMVKDLPKDDDKVTFANRVLALARRTPNFKSDDISYLVEMVDSLPEGVRPEYIARLRQTFPDAQI